MSDDEHIYGNADQRSLGEPRYDETPLGQEQYHGHPEEQNQGFPEEQYHGYPGEQNQGFPEEQHHGYPEEQHHGYPDPTGELPAPPASSAFRSITGLMHKDIPSTSRQDPPAPSAFRSIEERIQVDNISATSSSCYCSEFSPEKMTRAQKRWYDQRAIAKEFEDPATRAMFIRKMFLVFALQMLFLFGIVVIMTFVESVKVFIQENPSIYMVAFGVVGGIFMILFVLSIFARQYPHNICVLILLTMALSFMFGTIASYHDTYGVFISAGMVLVVCGVVILFSLQSKYVLTMVTGLFLVTMLDLALFGVAMAFAHGYYWQEEIVYAFVGSLCFLLFLNFEVHFIINGYRHHIYPKEFVFGGILIYLDFGFVFMEIMDSIKECQEEEEKDSFPIPMI